MSIEETFFGIIGSSHRMQDMYQLIENTAHSHSQAKPTRETILEALETTKGNRTKAAKMLGVSRVTLWKYLKKMEPTQ